MLSIRLSRKWLTGHPLFEDGREWRTWPGMGNRMSVSGQANREASRSTERQHCN